MAALRPDWEDRGPLTDTQRIDDEIKRQVAQCTCRQKFKVFQVGEGKYRVRSESESHCGAESIHGFPFSVWRFPEVASGEDPEVHRDGSCWRRMVRTGRVPCEERSLPR